MAVRLEWTTAEAASAGWVPPGEEAGDGQVPAQGGGALVLGSLAIEGSPDEIANLLNRALAVLPREGPELRQGGVVLGLVASYARQVYDKEAYVSEFPTLLDELIEVCLRVRAVTH